MNIMSRTPSRAATTFRGTAVTDKVVDSVAGVLWYKTHVAAERQEPAEGIYQLGDRRTP